MQTEIEAQFIDIDPEDHAGEFVMLRDEKNQPLPFSTDPVLAKLFSDIHEAIPFQLPQNFEE